MSVNRADMHAAVLFATRAMGCTCDVRITVDEVRPGIFASAVEHHDRCPLLLVQARHTN